MPHTYKFEYFNVTGLGDGIRFLFHLAGQEFEDSRIEQDEWPAIKSRMPFAQVPLLTVDGNQWLCQTKAIARYLAGQFGLMGADAFENARIDMIADRATDLYDTLGTVYGASDDTARAAAIPVYLERAESVLASLEKLLVDNGGGDGYLVGNKLTWVDATITGVLTFINKVAVLYGYELPLHVCPKLVALCKRVESVPAIAAYIAKRPVSDM